MKPSLGEGGLGGCDLQGLPCKKGFFKAEPKKEGKSF
jgi:hypothetical protein